MVDFLLGGKADRAGDYPRTVPANHPPPPGRSLLRSAVFAFPGVLVVMVATVRLAFERLEIVGESMCPTLEPGDRVLALRFARARVGDLVALADPREADRVVVKRVVAIKDGHLSVLGDNSASSTDSRHFGPVARSLIRGRIVYRYAPESRRGWTANSRASRPQD
jgi:nickel-type superoxide dismutase maturation protease